MSTSLVLILLISSGGNLEISISLETILSISSGDNLEISISPEAILSISSGGNLDRSISPELILLISTRLLYYKLTVSPPSFRKYEKGNMQYVNLRFEI